MNISLLNSPLLSWDGILDFKTCKEKNSEIIEPIYLQNMKTNAWFKQYKNIFEQSNDYVSMCVLSSNVVDDIRIIKIMFQIIILKVCMLLMKCKIYHFYLTCVLIHNLLWIYFLIIIGIFKKRLQKNNAMFHEQLIIRYNGLQDNTSITL